eukprot:gene7376-7217_t
MNSYLAHEHAVPVMRLRLGIDINVQALKYDESVTINGVNISLHPAGHIWGSAQVRLEYKGEIWVVSGDYKLQADGISQPFEPEKADEERKEYITGMWQKLAPAELFVFNKFITGGFRVGVSEKIVIKALAKQYGIEENIVAHKLTGQWDAREHTISTLLAAEGVDADISKPYPFYLAYPLETPPEDLGNVSDWFIERKYDGIRGQLITRRGELFVWSRGEDLLTDKFVEFHNLVNILPDGTVLDGEIIPIKEGKLLPFHVMQTRIGRKNVTKQALRDAPLVMICYDLLEYAGTDVRHLSLQERREILERLLEEKRAEHPDIPLHISPLLSCNSWQAVAEERTHAREQMSEGLMLKRKNSEYKTGRRRGDWWKWKIDPLSIDGVLLYAQRGHGRRANLYTDFTFAVWDGEELVPFCKAYSGLTDKEMNEVDAWRDTWQAIADGYSGVLNAPTGYGKTYAIWFGVLQHYFSQPKAAAGLHCLWISPLRALSKDIHQATERVSADLKLPYSIGLRTGDTSTAERAKQKKAMPHALITTPESVHLLLAQKGYTELFRNLAFVVIDEWHELIGTKRGVQVELALSRLRAINPALRIWGISATIGNLEEAGDVLLGSHSGLRTMVRANLEKRIEVETLIPHDVERYPWGGHLGIQLLEKVLPIIHESTSTLLFTNTRSQCEIWYQRLLERDPSLAGAMALHHGSLSEEVRQWVEESLDSGILKVVVCTSSLDLGVDFRP